MKRGWLVNDCLTCIPGTKTFWHDLLEWIPGLEAKCIGGYDTLPDRIEQLYERSLEKPDYIIRNSAYFRKLNIPVKTYSLVQDVLHGAAKDIQVDVCNSSNEVVFNSPYTYCFYIGLISQHISLIPLGVDSIFFNKSTKHQGILPESILFVGAANNHPKGFDKVLNLINSTNYNFCLVMKDDFQMVHPRVRVFNKINHDTLLQIYNTCKLLICTSEVETQHLASIEAGFCNLPVVTNNVGIHYNRDNGSWGINVKNNDYISAINYVINNYDSFRPREYLLKESLDKESCKESWRNLIC